MNDIEGIFSKAFRGIFCQQDRTPEEIAIARGFKEVFNARLEVRTPAGIVDLVSDEYQMIAEIKRIGNWKHAIGQILVYKHYFPDKTPFIILFGEADDKFKDMVREHAKRFLIAVMFASGLSENEKEALRENNRKIIGCKEDLKVLTKKLADAAQMRLEI